ncbi:MAG: manganese efflux pump [Alistipes sp.]|nr:manganese efflux pump [Candidatus Minthomonas equi]
MSYFELFLLAIGLSFDTFAVSISGGIGMGERPRWYQVLKIICFFGLFQSGFTALGWGIGISVSSYIEDFDHWIAFVLLSYIGVNMIREGFSKETSISSINLLRTGSLCVLAIATSIDALATGISLALIKMTSVRAMAGFAMIFLITALASLLGLKTGGILGVRFGKRSEFVGGLILTGIGLKILLEHLW